MKYLFITEDLYGGGAEKVLINTADGLQKRGHDVLIFILRHKVEHSIPHGLNIKNINCVNIITKIFDFEIIRKIQAYCIKKQLKKFNPDVIISCSADKITKHLQSERIYFWIHGAISAFNKKDKYIERARRLYNNKNLIVVSHGIADDIENISRISPKSMRVIYNPFSKEVIEEKAEEDINIPFDKYLIHIGSFEKRKRHDFLLKAYKKSKTELPLILLGKGDEEKNIRNLINELSLNDKVFIFGYTVNPYPYIKKASALLLTSEAEGLPTVLIESIILSCPIVSVNCPSGPSEILLNELAPYLTPLNDIDSFATAINAVIVSPPKIIPEHYHRFTDVVSLIEFEKL